MTDLPAASREYAAYCVAERRLENLWEEILLFDNYITYDCSKEIQNAEAHLTNERLAYERWMDDDRYPVSPEPTAADVEKMSLREKHEALVLTK